MSYRMQINHAENTDAIKKDGQKINIQKPGTGPCLVTRILKKFIIKIANKSLQTMAMLIT